MIRTRLSLCALVVAAACAPAKEPPRGDTLQPVDTMKPARDTLPTPAGTTTGTKVGATTKAKTPPVNTKTKDSIIGHDSVTPLDPMKRKLPTVKKP